MIQHRHKVRSLPLCLLCALHFTLFTACSSEQDTYPNVITEMADIHTDEAGNTTTMELDNGQAFGITNPTSGLKSSHTYRVLAGYVALGDKATLYSSQGAYILNDSTLTPQNDPTRVVSVWRTDRYINLHLAPLTQGGIQHWGIITDSIVGEHRYLYLHHNQNGDPTSYTTDVYASLPIEGNDRITLRIKTFEGTRTFEL